MKIYIEALELSLSPEELKAHVPVEKLEALKGQGIFQAYTLAHEGISRPRVIGKGTQVLKWPRAVIRTLASKIQSGTKFFLGHGIDNSNIGRESVGEVLSSFTKEIGGKLSNIIIGWFPNKEKVQAMDTCSMEADVHTDEEFIVGDINEVTGIALGNTKETHPAFPGALRLSMVQCFTEPKIKPGEGANEVADKITFQMVEQGIKEMNIFPWQVFSLENLKNDKIFGKLFTDNSTLKAENERLSKEHEKMTTDSKDAIRKSELLGAQEKLDVLMKEGFTDKQKQFIKGDFKPEDIKDLTDEGVSKFLENSKKKFTEQAKLFGVEVSLDKPKPKDDSTSAEEDSMEDEALKLIGAIPDDKSK